MKKQLLITGCPRSGTTYSARAFRVFNRELMPHEQIGDIGTVSWYFGPEKWKERIPEGKDNTGLRHHIKGETPEHFEFATTVLVVRHPLKVIPSAKKIVTQRDWDWAAKHVNFDPKAPRLIRGAEFWIAWNAHIHKRADFFYRVEEMDKAWESLLKAARLPSVPFPPLKTTINQARGWNLPEPLTLDDLKKLSADTACRVVEAAEVYGYDL